MLQIEILNRKHVKKRSSLYSYSYANINVIRYYVNSWYIDLCPVKNIKHVNIIGQTPTCNLLSTSMHVYKHIIYIHVIEQRGLNVVGNEGLKKC